MTQTSVTSITRRFRYEGHFLESTVILSVVRRQPNEVESLP